MFLNSGLSISGNDDLNLKFAFYVFIFQEALDEKIEKVEADVIAAKKRYDPETAVLKELLDKRDAIRKDEILSAIVKSGRSYEEIMDFLNVEETERETTE